MDPNQPRRTLPAWEQSTNWRQTAAPLAPIAGPAARALTPSEQRRLWLEPISEDNPSVDAPTTLSENKWRQMLRETNYAEMAHEIWRAEEGRGLLRQHPYASFCNITRNILASTGKKVLETVCRGNLTKERRVNPAVKAELEENAKRNSELEQPSIYMLELVCRDDFEALSPNQLLDILHACDKYARGNPADYDLINKIDNWMSGNSKTDGKKSMGQTRQGERRYFKQGQTGTTQTGKYYELRDNMRALFRDMTPHERRMPLKQPVREVGYALKGPDRLKEHLKHRSSNYLMNLFDAVCGALWPEKFEIRGHVIYLIWDGIAGAPAELVFSVLASAYTKTGLGFCHQPAGLSNTSAWQKQWPWNDIKRQMRYRSAYLERVEADNAKLDALKRKDQEVRELKTKLEALRLVEQPPIMAGRSDDEKRQELAQLMNMHGMLKLLGKDLKIILKDVERNGP